MKKRALSLLMAVIMVVSLLPTAVWAAGTGISSFFENFQDILVAETEPGSPSSTNKWKTTTYDGETVLMSGNKGKDGASSTLQLTFKTATHASFEYKVSTEDKCDKVNIKLGSTSLLKDASGDLAWKTCEFDAEQNDILTIVYKKDYSGDEYGDCVYVRNFSCGTPIVVTLHANNGTNDTKTQNIYGGKGTLNANTFTCEGKVFAGWATTPDGNVTYSDGAEISPTEAMELYAVWGNAYTITFDYNDGKTAKKTVDVAQDSAIGAVNMPADPSRTGYIFGGWYADGGKDALTKDTVISASVTYTAKWTPITYTIVLNPGDGTGEPVTLPVATYDQEVILPANTFTRDGYEFNGWSTSSGSSYGSYKDQDTVKNLTNKDGNSVNLYATWRGKSVSVTVNPNYAGAQTTTRTGTVGSNYNYDNGNFNAIADPTRTGYIFDGWFNAAEGGTEITNQYKFTAEDAENGITLYAHWTKGITVHFDGNGYKNTNSLKDKTVTPDKVFSSLPYTSKYYYPANKALDGWYIKTADGSFGEAVTKDTKFDGLDEVTLIAKWRDYQYIIKYSLKYSDKSSTTGTMADQPAPFGQDVKLSKCTYVRDGYDFAGWAENSYSSTAKYKDEGTINREWDDDDYGYGSEDNESYTLYAMWTKSAAVDPDKQAADAALTQAETAIKVDYYPTYGTDKSATDMVQAKLTAANVSGVTVALKSGATVQSGTDLAAVKDDGSIQYNWNETNVVSGEARIVRPVFQLTYTGANNKTYTRDVICEFYIGLDEEKAMASLNAIADSFVNDLPKEISTTNGLDGKLPSVGRGCSAAWSSNNSSVVSVGYSLSLGGPCTVTVTLPKEQDATVTLTLNLTYNQRSDLKVERTAQVTVKKDPNYKPVDYQAVLDKAFQTVGMTDYVTGAALDQNHVVNDIRIPSTRDLGKITYADYNKKGFDGKYTPVVITSSNPDVIKNPDVGNVARLEVYRPDLNGEPVQVSFTVKILSRPSGEGRDYDSMPVLAEKTFTVSVQPITQEEIDAELAMMQQVKEHYWDGIKKANSDKNSVTGDLQSFIEVYEQDGQLVWVRDEKDCKDTGIKAVALDGWYEGGQAWRCFKSSNPDVISHENLLVTRQKENKAVTITSCLSSDRFGRYESVYPDACFKELTRQIVSASVIVKGTEPTHSGVVSEKSQVSFTLQTANSTWITKTTVYDLPEGTTVFDVFKRVLGSNNYTYGARGSYIYSITSPSGETLGEFDLGENSGWMYKVNGVIVDQYMNAQTVSNRDNIVVFFTKDYTEETGYGHSGGSWNGTNAADKKAAASVDDLISAIGGVRLSSEKDIAAARAAYDKLTDAQKKLVSNYDILTAAEQALADLKAGKLPFTDVQAGAWYADAVKYVFDQGLMSGMSAQEFGPDGQVTRGQVVTILWRLAGSPTVSGKAFPDVSASAWYADAVAWASANGVVSGYENGGFGPGDPVTREQLAAILYRYAQLSGKDTDQTADLSGYTDSVTISAWAPQALKWAVGSGLISGTGTHTLSPRGTATRAQIAVILQNFCK